MRALAIVGLLELGLLAGLLPAQETFVVEGEAVNSSTGTGVAGAVIRLSTPQAPLKAAYTTTSGADGKFRIEPVPAGDYLADAQGPFDSFPLTLRMRGLHLDRATSPLHLTFSLVPWGKLHGRVIDRERRPVAAATVELLLVYGKGGSFQKTGANGEFAFERVLPGFYKLRARPVAAKTRYGEQQVPTYYPSGASFAGAVPVEVGVAPLPDFEIQLGTAAVFSVRGMVVNADGEACANVRVALRPETNVGGPEATTRSAPDGTFELTGVRAGNHILEAAEGTEPPVEKAELAFTMPDRDLDNLRVALEAPFTAEATIEGLPEGINPGLVLYPETERGGAPGEPAPGGVFRFVDVYPAEYIATYSVQHPDYYLASVLVGTDEVFGRPFRLGPQSQALHFRFHRGAAKLVGQVKGGMGAGVVLIDTASELRFPLHDTLTALCDSQGRFTIGGLRPSSYYALAFPRPPLNPAAVRYAVFSLGLAREARKVTLKEDETGAIELKLTPLRAGFY